MKSRTVYNRRATRKAAAEEAAARANGTPLPRARPKPEAETIAKRVAIYIRI